MKTLMVLTIVGEGERSCRIFDEDLSRFDGAGINGGDEDLGEEVYPIIYNKKCNIIGDWAVGTDCTAMINAKEWDIIIFVDEYL